MLKQLLHSNHSVHEKNAFKVKTQLGHCNIIELILHQTMNIAFLLKNVFIPNRTWLGLQDVNALLEEVSPC